MSEVKQVKKCSKCKLTYYTDAFWKAGDKLKSQCINCEREYRNEVIGCGVCGKTFTKAINARHKYQCALQQEAQLIGVSKFNLCHYYILEGIDKQPLHIQRGVKYMCNCYNDEEWEREHRFAKSMKQEIYNKIHEFKQNAN